MKDNFPSRYLTAYKLLHSKSRFAADAIADVDLPDHTRAAMAKKLAATRRNKGKGGWWDEERCSINSLREKLRAAVDENNMIDIINYAAMIHFREQASEVQ